MSTDTGSSGVRRRDFLKILGVTGAATAAVGCSTDNVEKLIPYTANPDQTVPGVSNYYATVCRECSTGCGVLAETRDGRVIKLEGNPDHPVNRGALCARGQAAPQGLYNPDRFRGPMVRENGRLVPTTWDRAQQRLAQILGQVRSGGQAGNAAFVNASESGSFPAFLDQWLAAFGMPAHLSYDADADLAAIGANRQTYGGTAWPALDFSAARLIVSFGADFLDGWGPQVPQQLAWADARAKLVGSPRMIYVGPRRTLTGLNADEWVACRPGSELALLNALRGQGGLDAAAQASGVPVATLQRLQREITSAKPSLVLAGGGTAAASELALAANQWNQALGNVGSTVRPTEAATGYENIVSHADIRALGERMAAGQVPLVMFRGVNPVYTTPKALGFAAALAKVPNKISFSSYPDETTELCDLVLPDHHALESWGDAEPVRGMLALQQPAMDPVFETRQTADVLILAAKADPAVAARFPYADYRSFLIGRFPGGAPAFTKALATGIAPGATLARTAPGVRAATAAPAPALESTTGDFYLIVYPSPTLGDGRGANKPWLQELPDPVTKILWQSVVEMHPQTAKKLGVENGDHVTVQTAAGSITAPAYVYLGIRPDTVAVAMGRGHFGNGPLFDGKREENGRPVLHLTGYGRYAHGVGVNALDLLGRGEDPRSGAQVLTQTKARVTKASGNSMLVTTEGSARQHGRGIGQAILVSDLGRAGAASDHGAVDTEQRGPAPESNPGSTGEPGQRVSQPGVEGAGGEHGSGQTAAAHGAAAEKESYPGDASHAFLPGLRSPVANDAQGDFGDSSSKDLGMYNQNHWSGMARRRWAMTIDLARCTGCSACVTACYAENNLPTVGGAWQGPQVMPDRTGFGANVTRGREMSWLRLERYYEGAENAENEFEPNFDTRFVPMLCQHCGNAPCEPVCPVYATYHSPDGLNVQVYNRCVGTRYCSNNCPYKVRYFNWFGYGEPHRPQYAFPEPLNWQLNPDVTVRGKGVMEKCTFCVQRIREAEHRAKLEHRELQPDEFTTACAQACPSRAIVFGDAADANWSVAELARDARAYHVFEELNTYTAVVYLKKVNHPGTAAPAGAATGA